MTSGRLLQSYVKIETNRATVGSDVTKYAAPCARQLKIAQGGVRTGAGAIDLGLVDELGTLEDAVVASAALAALTAGAYGRETIRHGCRPLRT